MKAVGFVRQTLSVAPVLLLAALAGCGPGPVPKAAPPAGSWLVLLCRASDAPQDPQPKAFYEQLFSKNQRDLLFDYFQTASHQTIDVSGTEVYGWFSMSVKTADIAPAVRNNGTPVTRSQTANDCKASALGGIAATGVSVDPANYAGVITIINVPVDSGEAGAKAVVLGTQAETEVAFVVHEMLHVYGLTHAWTMTPDVTSDHVWNHGGDVEYNDCWDVMSYASCAFTFPTSRGPQGMELQAASRERLRWLPANRVQIVSAYPQGTTTITLAPLGDPSKPGPLLAKVEVPNLGYYAIEYRQRNSGFDRGILNSVVIRELRTNGITYLVLQQDNDIGWNQGEVFFDTANFLRISIDSIATGGATITVNNAFSTAAPAAGAICGDKYRGQVLACPSTTQCMSRRTGMIQSIDWFCL